MIKGLSKRRDYAEITHKCSLQPPKMSKDVIGPYFGKR